MEISIDDVFAVIEYFVGAISNIAEVIPRLAGHYLGFNGSSL